jgi:predicted cupin superfamily sugar epimerase
MTSQAQYWIDKLNLLPHPEGGYYRETYRAELSVAKQALPAGFNGARSISTAIYFLLNGENFSAFHRLRSDEVWHFYAGGTLVIHVIKESGERSEIQLSGNREDDHLPQAVIQAGWWFACRVRDSNSFALVGCTVAPGFDFADFEMAKRAELIKAFPQHQELIERFTRS